MTTAEIYEAAKNLTTEQIEKQIASWKAERNGARLYAFNSLVNLGDAEALAMATVLSRPQEEADVSEVYRAAYYS
jgi:hypothetical protein